MAYAYLISYSSTTQAVIELVSSSAKLFATTATIHFCVNCWIISKHFQMIECQVKKLSESSSIANLLALQLRQLQNHHVLICRSVELLNESFGGILCLEIFFIFTAITNNLMRILTRLSATDLYNNITEVVLIANLSGNLILICHSAERIRAKVLKKNERTFKILIHV